MYLKAILFDLDDTIISFDGVIINHSKICKLLSNNSYSFLLFTKVCF